MDAPPQSALWQQPPQRPPKPAGQSSDTSARIGTRMRGRFGEIYEKRGKSKAYITLTYSIKAARDVGLLGLAARLDFFACEGDPHIQKVQYRPQTCLAAVGVTSVALTKDRILQLRVIRTKRDGTTPTTPRLDYYADQLRDKARRSPRYFDSVEIKHLGAEDLVGGHEVRLRNWHELLPWVAQVRFHHLGNAEKQFVELLNEHRELTVRKTIDLAKQIEVEPALMLGAAIRGAAFGKWATDFDSVRFGAHSIFRLGAP